MKTRDVESLVARQRETCIHFTGLQNKVCEAGVDYASMRDVSGPGMACWPCLGGHRPCATACPKRELHNEEQAREFVTRVDQAIEAAFARVDAGLCHECSEPIEPSRVVGRCRYGACGHRIGQALTEGDDE